MYQPLRNEQQQQHYGATQPVARAAPPPPAVCERYANIQSKFAARFLTKYGIFSIVFNLVGILCGELATIFGQGLWCGTMVS